MVINNYVLYIKIRIKLISVKLQKLVINKTLIYNLYKFLQLGSYL